MQPPSSADLANIRQVILLTLHLVLKLQERDSSLSVGQRAYLTQEINQLIESEINPRIAAWPEPKLKRPIHTARG